MPFQNVSPNDLTPNPSQPRKLFEDEALRELAASIAQNGLMQPIVVRATPSGFQIVAGERRWRACRMAGLESVPVNVMTLDDEQTMVLAITENVTRADMTEIEEANAYASLVAMGRTPDEVAAQFGKSVMWVTSSLELLSLTPEIQWLVAKGALTKNVGCYISRLDVEAQKDVLRRVNAGEFPTNDAIIRYCTIVQKVQDQPSLFEEVESDPLADARRAKVQGEIERARAKLAGMAPALRALMELEPGALASAMDERLEAELDALVTCVTRARNNVRQARAIRKVVAA